MFILVFIVNLAKCHILNLHGNLFTTIGVSTILFVSRLYTNLTITYVPKIALAGGIEVVTQNKTAYLLDNRYIIIRQIPHVKPFGHIHKLLVHAYSSYMAIKNHKKVPATDLVLLEQLSRVDLDDAHLAALMEHERKNLINAWESICRQRQQTHRIHRW